MLRRLFDLTITSPARFYSYLIRNYVKREIYFILESNPQFITEV